MYWKAFRSDRILLYRLRLVLKNHDPDDRKRAKIRVTFFGTKGDSEPLALVKALNTGKRTHTTGMYHRIKFCWPNIRFYE